MTDLQLRDELVTFVLAAHETTALTMIWTSYLLAQHPEVDARLQAELSKLPADRPPEAGDIPALPYLESVVKESMRLYPPAYAFGRLSLADWEVAGYRIPAGTMVSLVPWVIHRDERFFLEATAFRPERWTSEFTEKLPRFAYFPFGGGPRICIGSSFAMLEAILVLATVLRKYRFELEPGQQIRPAPAVTLKLTPGVRMRLHAR